MKTIDGMNSDELGQAADAYEKAFGEDAMDALYVPNYIGDSRLAPALAEAVRIGKPITDEQATALFGEPPFREEVI